MFFYKMVYGLRLTILIENIQNTFSIFKKIPYEIYSTGDTKMVAAKKEKQLRKENVVAQVTLV